MLDSRPLLLHTFLYSYRRAVSRILDPFVEPAGLVLLAEADNHNRFRAVARNIVGNTILDVGSGGKSFFSLRWSNCVSVDLRIVSGVDVVASAAHLPFRSDSFETVVCVDTLEHIPNQNRKGVLLEIKRVAARRAVVHTPVQDNVEFLGRSSDIALDAWYKEFQKRRPETTVEHIKNVEPSRRDLEDAGFVLKGTHNASHWLRCMRLASYVWPLGALASQTYYLTHRSKRFRPPFWGAACVFDKSI